MKILLDNKILKEFNNLKTLHMNFPMVRLKSQSMHTQKLDVSSNTKYELKPIKLFDLQMKEKDYCNNSYEFKPSFKIFKSKNKKMIEKIDKKLIFLADGINELEACKVFIDEISKNKDKAERHDNEVLITKINWLYLNKFLNFDNPKRMKEFKEDVFILYLIENLQKDGIFLEKNQKILINVILNSLRKIKFQQKELKEIKHEILNCKSDNIEKYDIFSEEAKSQTLNLKMKVSKEIDEPNLITYNTNFSNKENQIIKETKLNHLNLKSINSEEKEEKEEKDPNLENQASNTTEITIMKNGEIMNNKSNLTLSSNFKKSNSLNSFKSITNLKRSSTDRFKHIFSV